MPLRPDIGRDYGVPRERVRRLETRARERLKEVLEGGLPEPRGRKQRRRGTREQARDVEAVQVERIPVEPTPVDHAPPAPKPSPAKRAGEPEGQGTLS